MNQEKKTEVMPDALQIADTCRGARIDDDCPLFQSVALADAEYVIRKQHACIAELEAQLSAIGGGGVESLRKRECLHQSENAATDRDTHFYLAGWNGARGNEDSHEHFSRAMQAAPAHKDEQA